MYRELAAKGMSTEQSSTYIAQQITSQGLIIAANEIFWLCGGVFILLIVAVWFAKPPFGSAANKNSPLIQPHFVINLNKICLVKINWTDLLSSIALKIF